MNSILNSITSTASAFEGEKWRAAFDIYTSAFDDLERHYSALQKRQRSNGGSVSSTADDESETILTGLTYVDELKTARDAYISGLPSRETISTMRRSAGFSRDHARSMYRTSRARVGYMEAVVEAAESSWTEKRETFEDTYKRKLFLDYSRKIYVSHFIVGSYQSSFASKFDVKTRTMQTPTSAVGQIDQRRQAAARIAPDQCAYLAYPIPMLQTTIPTPHPHSSSCLIELVLNNPNPGVRLNPWTLFP
jgi:hypothetical protein